MIKESIRNVSFSKSGKGDVTPKTSIPLEWVRDMNLEDSAEEKKIILKYDTKTKTVTVKKYKG